MSFSSYILWGSQMLARDCTIASRRGVAPTNQWSWHDFILETSYMFAIGFPVLFGAATPDTVLQNDHGYHHNKAYANFCHSHM